MNQISETIAKSFLKDKQELYVGGTQQEITANPTQKILGSLCHHFQYTNIIKTSYNSRKPSNSIVFMQTINLHDVEP